MGLGKLFKKLLPVAKTSGTIVVTEGTSGTLVAVAFRQLLMVGGTYLATRGIIADDDVPTVVGAVITLSTVAYGQLKSKKDHVEKVVLADAAPNGQVVSK